MVVGEISEARDLVVIGGGPGGYTAAIRAAQHDVDVTLVEKSSYGGTCLNHGCIPSKALISVTGVAERVSDMEEMGVYADPEVDVGEMYDWKDGIVDRMSRSVEKLCKANQVDLIQGEAVFEGENQVRVEEKDGNTNLEFGDAIVATGSRAIEIDGFSYSDPPVMDAKQALDIDGAPDSLVIVGAGYIGMEMAGVFAKLNVDVTVVEALDGVLPGYSDDLSDPVKSRLESQGVGFHFGESAEEWRESADGIEVVTKEMESGDENVYGCEKVLVAVGREPVFPDGLEIAGVEINDDGFLVTDRRTQTTNPDVYGVGDVAGEPLLAHKAGMEGRVAAGVVAGQADAVDYQAVPSAVFTDPEIATVGLTRGEAENEGFEPVVGEFPFRASGRALTLDETDGFVRLIAAESGFILGGEVVGPEASELIAEIGFGIEMGATLEDIAATIHTHPTLSESVMEAAENAADEAIHTLNR